MKESEKAKKVSKAYVFERGIWACLVIISFICLLLFRDSPWGFRVSSAITVIALFILADKIFEIGFHKRHHIFWIILLVLGFIASPLYFIYPNYDKILHLFGPILFTSIIFFMLRKLNLEMKWKITFAFLISFSLLSFFELAEYTLDSLFDFKLQGVFIRDVYGIEKLNVVTSPLDDTMIDLFFGAFGTALYCLFVSLVYKRRTHRHLLNYS